MYFTLGVLLLMSVIAAHGAVVGKEVTYTVDSLTMKGYIAYDDKISGKRPGILVVHEWWGNNEYSRKRADMLAELGYVALALDMYGNGKQADNPGDAGKFAGEVSGNPTAMKARFMAAMDLLKKDQHVDSKNSTAFEQFYALAA
jgi:dienelactone hydrolase